jgi:hypothetical protein
MTSYLKPHTIRISQVTKWTRLSRGKKQVPTCQSCNKHKAESNSRWTFPKVLGEEGALSWHYWLRRKLSEQRAYEKARRQASGYRHREAAYCLHSYVSSGPTGRNVGNTFLRNVGHHPEDRIFNYTAVGTSQFALTEQTAGAYLCYSYGSYTWAHL